MGVVSPTRSGLGLTCICKGRGLLNATHKEMLVIVYSWTMQAIDFRRGSKWAFPTIRFPWTLAEVRFKDPFGR